MLVTYVTPMATIARIAADLGAGPVAAALSLLGAAAIAWSGRA